MSKHSNYLAIILSMLFLQVGCKTIPDYHQPAGFSSTYHQKIYPETAIASLPESSAVREKADQGVFFPNDVKVKQPKYHAPLAEIRGPITDEELKNTRRRLQLDSLRRADEFINQEPIYNQNFPAPAAW